MSVSVLTMEETRPQPPLSGRNELLLCGEDPAYFIDNFCQIYDATARAWIPFRLWLAQAKALDVIDNNRLAIILKARQLGFSWLVVGYTLWIMLYRPAATVLIFSKRDDEATELLAFRLKGMYFRLPEWMQTRVSSDSAHNWVLDNGSRAMAFPVTGGRSYTGTFVIVDEADYVPDLNVLLNAVKPTIDAGGKMVLISTVDKAKPMSPFKRIYTKAKTKENSYQPIFCSWRARPGRDDQWYEEQRRDILARTGALDDLHQEYPATDTEALAPRILDKRIAPVWLQQCYNEIPPLDLATLSTAPAIPGLTVYVPPDKSPFQPPRRYVLGADPAEGNPTSDDSALTVLDVLTGEEVACLTGKLQPSTFAEYLNAIGTWYNDAALLVERNNHGHAVLLWLTEHSALSRLEGHDGNNGWLSSAKGKSLLYDAAADAFRNKETILHSFATFTQLSSIEGSTLRAPEGMHDDRADSYALALQGVLACQRIGSGYGAAPSEESIFHNLPEGVFLGDEQKHW